MLIYRPANMEAWHLIAMLLAGVVVVTIVHRLVRRRAAQMRRDEQS